tara:strand:- start:511 stop:927 length:417 start_codon:yes stop_codon:yes gene_type:complete
MSSVTIDTLAQQLNLLVNKLDKLEAFVYGTPQEDNSQSTQENKEKKLKKEKKENKEKKEKKEKTVSSDDEKPKKVSGYILFSKAKREHAIETLQGSPCSDVKIKSTDVMKELGKMWKELDEHEKELWNAKAKPTVEAA